MGKIAFIKNSNWDNWWNLYIDHVLGNIVF